LPEDRAKRINGLLQPKNNWTKEDVSKMMIDNTSSTAQETVRILLSNVNCSMLSKNEKEAFAILKNWEATNSLEDVAPTIYNKWIFLYLKNTFKDEMGEENFKLFLTTHILKQVITAQIKNEYSPWWNNITTKNTKETRSQIVSKSFIEAISQLEEQLGTQVKTWTWNRVHTLEHQHPMGKIAALRSLFNVGPFEISGANEVINNQIFIYTENGNNKVMAGPSTRRIIDFSDVENSWSILPTGQSGNPFSAHYDDQAQMYNVGKFRKMKMNKAEIIKTATKLIFRPY
jgi:penicillin amidase